MLEDLYHKPNIKLRLKKNGIEIETKLIRFEKDRVFLRLTDEFKSYLSFFTEGREVEMTISSDARVLQLISLVIDIEKPDIIVMEIHDDYSTVQRRKFIRTDDACNITVSSDSFILNTNTVNIGGGGLCFKGNAQFKIGETYNFKLLIPIFDDAIEGKGVIINKIEQDNDILVMFCFNDIPKEIQNKIVRFCFEKEFNK